jgi:hypothetical protein
MVVFVFFVCWFTRDQMKWPLYAAEGVISDMMLVVGMVWTAGDHYGQMTFARIQIHSEHCISSVIISISIVVICQMEKVNSGKRLKVVLVAVDLVLVVLVV